MKTVFKFFLYSFALILVTYPWWSLALFKKTFLEGPEKDALMKEVSVEILRAPEIFVEMKDYKLGSFAFKIPASYKLKDEKEKDMIFMDDADGKIIVFNGVREKEGWLKYCPNLRDIHTITLNDLNVLSPFIFRSYEKARALIIKKATMVSERPFSLYEKQNLFLTVHENNERMSVIETQKDCELLTISVISASEQKVNPTLPLIVADSIH